MEIKVFLHPGESPTEAEELLIKAITGKYDTSKVPHPDPVVNELTLKFMHEYNKQLVSMMGEIFEVMKQKDLGKSEEFEKGKKLPVGTVRVWSGVEHVKQSDGSWKTKSKVKDARDLVQDTVKKISEGFTEKENLDEDGRQIIKKITSGKGLVDKPPNKQEKRTLREWAKDKKEKEGKVYRVIAVDQESFFYDHIHGDTPIKIKDFEAWTKDRGRVYGYGKPKEGQEPLLLEIDTSDVSAVDISKYSSYPEEKEVRNLESFEAEVVEKKRVSGVGWQLKIKPIVKKSFEISEDILEKARSLPVGTIKVWDGQRYVKHIDGWVKIGGRSHGKVLDKNGRLVHDHDNKHLHTQLADQHHEDSLHQKTPEQARHHLVDNMIDVAKEHHEEGHKDNVEDIAKFITHMKTEDETKPPTPEEKPQTSVQPKEEPKKVDKLIEEKPQEPTIKEQVDSRVSQIRELAGKMRKKGGKVPSQLEELKKVDPQFAESIRSWTRGAYAGMKEMQRSGKFKKDLFPEGYKEGEVRKSLKQLEDKFKDLPQHEGKMVRDLNIPLDEAKKMFSPDSTMEMDSFSSFTSDPSGYMNMSVRLVVENNTSGRVVGGLSVFPGEKEVLVPKGTKYRVTGVKEQKPPKKPSLIVKVEEVMEKSTGDVTEKINKYFNDPISDRKEDKLEKSKPEITQEMRDFFDKRTKEHIGRVVENMTILGDNTDLSKEELKIRGEEHDKSKYGGCEMEPYVWNTEMYRCKKEGVDFCYPDGIKEKVLEATTHHVKNNRHHPEYHTKDEIKFDPNDRDKLQKPVDATKMSDLDLAEMVADWKAMSDEVGTNTAKQWADRNVNKRWLFSKNQVKKIYEYISVLESEEGMEKGRKPYPPGTRRKGCEKQLDGTWKRIDKKKIAKPEDILKLKQHGENFETEHKHWTADEHSKEKDRLIDQVKETRRLRDEALELGHNRGVDTAHNSIDRDEYLIQRHRTAYDDKKGN